MRKVLHCRPSASLVVSIVALVVAASGTAVAASKLLSGDQLIKKHSLSGNRVKNHTLTGAQINLNKLGKAPSAANADHATNATNATNAGHASNADNATHASDSANLGGHRASAYAASSIVRFLTVRSNGTIDAARSTTTATITHPSLGVYCFTGLSPAPVAALVSLIFGDDGNASLSDQVNPTGAGTDCAGDQIGVVTSSGGFASDEGFTLAIG